jgi:hypothetical protein
MDISTRKYKLKIYIKSFLNTFKVMLNIFKAFLIYYQNNNNLWLHFLKKDIINLTIKY